MAGRRGDKDRDLVLACTRAWNDWLYEEWYQPYRERIVPWASPS